MVQDRFQQGCQHKPQVIPFLLEGGTHPHVIGDNDHGEQLGKHIQAQEGNPDGMVVHGSPQEEPYHGDISNELHHRSQQLEKENIGQGERAISAVIPVSNHIAVHTVELEQATAPARTLAVEHLEVGRAFRPAASLGNLDNTVVFAGIAHIADHTGHHIHILREGVSVVAAGLDHDLAVEHAKAAGHVLQGIDPRQGGFADEEGTGVFQILEKRDQVVRRAGVHHLALFHDTAVTHAHGGTHGYHAAGRGHGGPDNAVQGVLVQHAVHVRANEELVGHHIDTGVGRIGLGTSVHLVHHGQALEGRVVALGLVQAAERLGLDFLYVGVRDLDQVKILDEKFQGLVFGAVVHNDHLKIRIVQAQQGLHVGNHRLFLIVRRGHDGDARRVGRLLEFFDGVGVVMVREVLPVFQERQNGHGHVAAEHDGGIHQHEVAEKCIEPLKHIVCCL